LAQFFVIIDRWPSSWLTSIKPKANVSVFCKINTEEKDSND